MHDFFSVASRGFRSRRFSWTGGGCTETVWLEELAHLSVRRGRPAVSSRQVPHQQIERGLLMKCDAEGGHGRGEARVPVRVDRVAVEG